VLGRVAQLKLTFIPEESTYVAVTVTETGPSETSTEFGTTEAETITGPVKSPAVGLALRGASVVVVVLIAGGGVPPPTLGMVPFNHAGGNKTEVLVTEGAAVVIGETVVVEESIADCGLPLCLGILTAVQILPYLVATQRKVLP
jgi:hypothetical protein